MARRRSRPPRLGLGAASVVRGTRRLVRHRARDSDPETRRPGVGGRSSRPWIARPMCGYLPRARKAIPLQVTARTPQADKAMPPENLLIARLPVVVRERLRPHLEVVRLDRGQCVCQSGEMAAYAYFPAGGFLSLEVSSV